ncbi:MAG TPA: FAD-binding oxidoreductase [Candidatus Saccharimonadales bacterium]
MNKIATYLQGHLRGEVLTGQRARAAYSHDGSILSVMPDAVIRPYNTNDVRKVARFAWQLVEKGHKIALTPRGGGTDITGAAIGSGIILDFSAHMGRILEVDTRQKLVRVQPGISIKTFNEALLLHGVALPPLLSADPDATVGGAIANNFAGQSAAKYGVVADWIEQLEVVLANGEVIQTGRLSKKELSKKKGLASMEGELYRAVDGIIADGAQIITDQLADDSVLNNLGYNISAVKRPDGSFDLMPLFLGSQGTLGVITEIIVKVGLQGPQADMLVIACPTLQSVDDATESLRGLNVLRLELLDAAAMAFAGKHQGLSYTELVGDETEKPMALLFATFDDASDRARHKKSKKAEKALQQAGCMVQRTEDLDMQALWWGIYERTVASLTEEEVEHRVPTPIIDDIVLPTEQFERYKTSLAEFEKKHHVQMAVWGSAAAGMFHVRPLLDLRRLSDRQKIFRLIDDYLSLISQLGGSFGAQGGEGRLLAPFLARKYTPETLALFDEIKQAFDPHTILNAGVKTERDAKKLVPLLADDYSPYTAS